MKKYLGVIVLIALFIGNINILNAEDLLPSEAYYKEHIAVNEVSATSPSLRYPGDEDDEWGNPGATGDGGSVGSPIGDAIIPILVAGLFYGSFLLYRRRQSEVK